MKLMTRGRFACAVLSWIGVLALLTIAPVALAQNAPIAHAGHDREIADHDGAPGESVLLDGSESWDPDSEGSILEYTWSSLDGEGGAEVIAVSLTPVTQVRLPDGVNTIQLVVRDDTGDTGADTVVITVGGSSSTPPIANAGDDRVVTDTDDAEGENVTLDGSGSFDPDGTIVSYEWFRMIGHGALTSLGTSMSPTLQTRLPDGVNSIQLFVTDNLGNRTSAGVLITVNPPSSNPPIANAGPDRTVEDADGAAGENVTLDGSASSDPDDDIVSYAWSINIGDGTESLGTSTTPTLQTRLSGRTNTIYLVVTDNDGNTASDTVIITVNDPSATPPTANAGPDRTVEDADGAAGENVTLDGSGSIDPDGTIALYEWWLMGGEATESLGSSTTPTLQARLPDGQNNILLVVIDNMGNNSSDTVLITVSAPSLPPTANAGNDRVVNDTDNVEGENVTLDGSASSDPDGEITNYRWLLIDGENVETLGSGTSPTLQARLPDGENTIELIVTDNSNRSDSDTLIVTVNGPTSNAQPTANAGADRVIDDADNAAGENVTLDGSASSDPDGNITNYAWYRVGGEGEEGDELGSGPSPTLQARLPDGETTIELVVTDNLGNTASDTVLITVNGPISNAQPTANAGADRTVADTDRAPGENVTLDGSASSDPDGNIVSYAWSRLDGETTQSLGTSPTLQVRLPDGENTIQLVVTDNHGNTASDTVLITVGAVVSVAPTANAGDDRTIADTDSEPGESVLLDGSWSVDPDGTLVDYAWSRIDGENIESLGNGLSPTLQVRLPDGENTIQLVVTDNEGNTASDTVLITINEVVITSLSNIPGLSPNQKRTAQALDRMCGQLRDQSGGEGPQLSADQQDLLTRCDGLQMNNTTANQVAALDEIVADDFAVARTQTLLFATTQYAGVMDRLLALRGGAKGISLAGLNIMVDDKPVPLAQLQDMVKGLLGGGASADESSADEPGGLLSDKWGLWARGNYSFGDKDRNSNSPAFDAEQWAMLGGIDYRFSDKIVGGASLAYGQSSIDIDGGQGGLDTDTWAVSLYGSAYATKQFYVDAIVNVADARYGADRNIVYVDGTGLVDLDASGDTSGMTYSAGLSGGRDFLVRGFTLSPTLGLFYIDATIDGFTERGAGGLNLIYDEQSFQSFTGNLGFRATYAWNLSWGVLLPHLRVDYVREFKNDVDVFGVRFAADPNAASTPPILVATDNPDESYWRLATGFSAQFVHGFSGYVEYQRLESFEFIDFQDVSLGLRFQTSF